MHGNFYSDPFYYHIGETLSCTGVNFIYAKTCNALIGYRVQDRGKLLENTIFNHLQIAGFDVKIGGLNNQEIDFVAEKNGERIYVQATLTINEEKTLEREFGNLLKIGDNYPKYVVTLDEFDGNTFEGVRCLSLRGFIGEILETPLSHL